MSANPIDSTTTDKPTGNLEELFRHHLAEAAVPPRPMLWDQIDNSLLQRQNETYRRRLAATRWVAAASLLLATLSGTGWWLQRGAGPGGQDLLVVNQRVSATRPASAQLADTKDDNISRHLQSAASGTANGATLAGISEAKKEAATQPNGLPNPTETAAVRQYLSSNSTPANGTARYQTGNAAVLALASQTSVPNSSRNVRARAVSTAATRLVAVGFSSKAATAQAGHSKQHTVTRTPSELSTANVSATAGRTTLAETAGRGLVSNTQPASPAGANQQDLAANSEAAGAMPTTSQLAFLNARFAAIHPGDAAALPAPLATIAVPEDGLPPVVPPASAWQFGASYTAAAFNPNINFSRTGGAALDYNPALGKNSPAMTEAAAAEYRDNLQAGLSQRLTLRATRRLHGRWFLSTGVEASQSRASSESSLAFVGEQIPDLGQPAKPIRATDFRYRTAGIPLEVRYANPVKRGWSAYGRLGAVVTALLDVRADVEGIDEATRTYSITSASTPYRRVLTNVRGAMGAQFRPTTGNWAFTLGPVAEAGVVSMNAHPAQSFIGQSRAYSFGVEAGVEFGRK